MMSLEEINKLASENKIGERGTPVVSFWPMRKKWEAFGDYWEQWGFDGDPRPETISKDEPYLHYEGDRLDPEIRWRTVQIETFKMPAILKLIYFVVPGTNIVCQVCSVHRPSSYDSGFYEERERLIAENLKWALKKRGVEVPA